MLFQALRRKVPWIVFYPLLQLVLNGDLSLYTCSVPCRLTLSTAEARKSLRFREIYDGDAMRIVVDAVAIGSEAEQVLFLFLL